MSNHSDNPELSSKTVCVVDDDSSVRSAICSLFRSLSYDVVPFASAFEFLSWIADFHADCLISDVQIPGINGIEMYVRMRAQGRQIPTIFITAYPTPDLEAKAVTAGALAFMPKPVNIRALTELVAGSVLRPSA